MKAVLPVIYFGDPCLPPAFPETDASGRGVGQDVSSYGLLGICLEAAIKVSLCNIIS